jgi:hypothetical protein
MVPTKAYCFVTALGSRKLLFCDWVATPCRGLPMNMTLMVALLAISATSAYAQDQPNVAKLKADAENVVEIVGSDKHKLQAYCEFAELSDQIGEANEDGDTKKAEVLSQKINELGTKLGPEFVALADALKNMDANSQVGPEIGLIFNKLDALCED